MKLSFPRLSFLRPSFWGVCSRSGLLVLEIVAAVVGLLVLLTGVFMWRLTWGPLALLRQFEIIDARMVVEDRKLGLTWYIAPLDLSFARDREGLAITAT